MRRLPPTLDLLLFVPQRPDRIESRRAPRGPDTEDHANGRRKAKRKEHGGRSHLGIPLERAAENVRDFRAKQHTQETAEQAEDHSLDEELKQNIQLGRA